MSEEFWASIAEHDLVFPKSLSEDLVGFPFSDGARAVLAHAARISTLKARNQETLSATFILVGAIDLARKATNTHRNPSDGDGRDLRAMVAAHNTLLGSEGSVEGSQFDVLVSGLVSRRWEIGQSLPLTDSASNLDIGISESVETGIKAASGPPAMTSPEPIFADSLLSGVIPASPSLRSRLEDCGLKPEDLVEAIRTAASPTVTEDLFGELYGIIERRATRDEETLNARQYAVALATLLRIASGELCLGIFGHWGIGKTYLAEMVGTLLTRRDGPESLTRALSAANIHTEAVSPDAFTQEYEVITFSAWRYRRSPELWVYLYETLSKACMASNRWSRLLRYNVLRQGHWPLVLALIATGAALASITLFKIALGAAVWLLPILGIGGLLWLVQVVFTTRKGMAAVLRRYTSLAHHNEQLGLQALLGDELRCLIIAWAPRLRLRLKESWRELLALPIVGGVWLLGRILPQSLREELSAAYCSLDGLLTGRPGCSASIQISSSWHAALAGFFWLLLFAVIVFLLQWRGRRKTDRILLIVDDLDRCAAEELIEVMESLKLLLEDPDIQERVQVLMLVDEGAMEYAIARKFNGLIETRARARAAADHSRAYEAVRIEVIREHVEKLFLCHFRLPVLSTQEVQTLTERYAVGGSAPSKEELPRRGLSWQGLVSRRPPPPSPDTPRQEPESHGFEQPYLWEEPKRDSLEAAKLLGETAPQADLSFTPTEVQQLAKTLAAWSNGEHRMISPRAIRAFLLKYKLSRLLRQLAGKPVDGTKLMEELAKSSFSPNGIPARTDGKDRRDIEVIVGQLA